MRIMVFKAPKFLSGFLNALMGRKHRDKSEKREKRSRRTEREE